MVVLGAVFVEFPVIQPLTDYIWLGVHPSADEQLLRVAQVLLALRHSLESLDSYYTKLNIPTDVDAPTNLARFFPYILSYPGVNGDVRFEYIIKLADESPTKAIFKARRVDRQDYIVVKFVQTYNFAAHRLLASHGLAPQLLYPETDEYEPVLTFGGLKLVVMAFVDGLTAHDAYGSTSTLPDVIFSKVAQAVTVLHEHGFVFGDLRPPNIMVSEEKAFLVDFDWCADDGEGRYPVSLNDVDGTIGWHPDVKRGGVMYKEHDLFMMEKLRDA
jgi:serine/threonine protein kinase